MNDNAVYDGFYKRKAGNGSDYNYDLKPLIENFDFYDFIDYANKNKTDDYGGFVMITPKQYIIGYNAGFGSGTHLSSFARAMQDIKGGGQINTFIDAANLNMECEDNYILGYIVYEKGVEKDTNKSEYCGYVAFDCKNNITPEQYDVFLKFYEDYNNDLNYVCNKFKFEVIYSYKNGNKKTIDRSKNLDNYKEYLSTRIEEKNNNLPNEVIIGKGINKNL